MHLQKIVCIVRAIALQDCCSATVDIQMVSQKVKSPPLNVTLAKAEIPDYRLRGNGNNDRGSGPFVTTSIRGWFFLSVVIR